MTFYRNWAKKSESFTKPHPASISRSAEPGLNDIEQAIEADRRWFAEHPDANEYIREFCPGEFGAAELPEIPSGFRYATLVTVIHRTNGIADGRHRRMIAVCDRTT
jgi:hypothetical protein